MNSIDRFSTTTTEASTPNRESLDSPFVMSSDGRLHTGVSSASSVGATYGDAHVQDCSESCNTDQWSTQTGDHHPDDIDLVELSDEVPSPERLAAAGDIPIYDSDGNARPFRSLYEGVEHQGQRQLLIFIRHFYCGACQAYVKRLCETVTPTAYFSLPVPTTITIVACGSPHHIPAHMLKTHCPFRMYTEPTRRVYKLFKMIITVNPGRKVEYMDEHVVGMVSKSIQQMFKKGQNHRDRLTAGHMFQVGGEFLFEEGEPIWCHRMRNIRGHADFPTLRRVLGLPQDEEDTEPGLLEKRDLRKSIEKSTSVDSEGPRGLRMVYETTGENGEIPRARLVRDSREIRP